VRDEVVRELGGVLGGGATAAACFISHDNADRVLARRLYERLRSRGIRCWLDEHQLRPGEDIYEMVDRTLRPDDRVLLCVSREARASWWIRDEVDRTTRREEEMADGAASAPPILLVVEVDGGLGEVGDEAEMSARLRPRVVARLGRGEGESDEIDAHISAILEALQS
jgi:hypothetical protein